MVIAHFVVFSQLSLCSLFITVLDRGYFIFNLLCWSLDSNIYILKVLWSRSHWSFSGDWAISQLDIVEGIWIEIIGLFFLWVSTRTCIPTFTSISTSNTNDQFQELPIFKWFYFLFPFRANFYIWARVLNSCWGLLHYNIVESSVFDIHDDFDANRSDSLDAESSLLRNWG